MGHLYYNHFFKQMDELHIPMIQWMVNLLILMVPDFPDPDTLIKLEEESAEKRDLGIAKLELDAIALAKKLSQYSIYLSRWNYLVILLLPFWRLNAT